MSRLHCLPKRAVALAAAFAIVCLWQAGSAEGQPAGKMGTAWSLPWDCGWVTSVSFVGPNRVAAGNDRGQILVWDLPEQVGSPAPAPARRLDGHTNAITRLLATPDGQWLISASKDHTLRYWDLHASPKGAETLVLNTRAIEEAAARKNAKKVAPVEVKVPVQQAARVLASHRDWVLGLAMSHDGNLLVSGDDKGEVVVWDRTSGKELRRWKVKGWAWAMAVSPDARLLAVSERLPLVFDSGRHAGLKLWDPQTGEMKRDLEKEVAKQMMSAAAFSPDGKLLAVGRGGEVDGQNGKVTLLDAGTGKKVRELMPGHLNGLTDLCFHPDGKHLFSSGRDTTVRVWSVADGKLVKELGRPRGGQFKDWIHAVSVSPDGKLLTGADMAGQVHIWALDAK
jgi:WD40 repeat protein